MAIPRRETAIPRRGIAISRRGMELLVGFSRFISCLSWVRQIIFCAYPKCRAVACRMYVSRHLYNFSLNSRRCLEQTCYKCFFDSFRFFQIVYTRLCLFMGKRKGVEVYKQEGRNLSFVEVSSFKHGIFPISIIAYNTLILSYFHITRCCSISKDTNFSANHNYVELCNFVTKGVVQ